MSNTPENEVRTSSVLDPENLLTAQLQALERRRSSTRYIIVIAIALLAIVVLTCFVMSVVVIRGDTMSPNIYDGDSGLIWKLGSSYKHGDIVFYKTDAASGIQAARVIGIPGDQVDFSEKLHQIKINGTAIDEPYAYAQTNAADLTYPLVLEKGEYFLLGDNRPQALDSRFVSVGAVKSSDIVGKLIFLFRSY